METGEKLACARCGQSAVKLDKPPMKGELGRKVQAHSCSACWSEWVAMGTRVINEFGLVLSTPAGRDAYDQHMIQFLQLEDV